MAEAENPQRLIALLRGLRAVRQFRPDPVPQEVVDSVLAGGCPLVGQRGQPAAVGVSGDTQAGDIAGAG